MTQGELQTLFMQYLLAKALDKMRLSEALSPVTSLKTQSIGRIDIKPPCNILQKARTYYSWSPITAWIIFARQK